VKISTVFPTPIDVTKYAGISLSPERAAAVEHAVNHHDALVDTMALLVRNIEPVNMNDRAILVAAAELLETIKNGQ
jgi:hypothetical protein